MSYMDITTWSVLWGSTGQTKYADDSQQYISTDCRLHHFNVTLTNQSLLTPCFCPACWSLWAVVFWPAEVQPNAEWTEVSSSSSSGMEYPGTHELIDQTIRKIDPDFHKDLYGNIVLSGGSTLFPKIDARLKKELSALAPAGMDINVQTYVFMLSCFQSHRGVILSSCLMCSAFFLCSFWFFWTPSWASLELNLLFIAVLPSSQLNLNDWTLTYLDFLVLSYLTNCCHNNIMASVCTWILYPPQCFEHDTLLPVLIRSLFLTFRSTPAQKGPYSAGRAAPSWPANRSSRRNGSPGRTSRSRALPSSTANASRQLSAQPVVCSLSYFYMN